MAKNDDSVLMENVRLIFRNFAGKEGQYNREGQKTFGVILPEDVAEQMLADGWNVKYLKAREEGDTDVPWLPVEAKWTNKPPKIVMITSRNRTHLDEDSVELLDYAEISNVDLIVNPYTWAVRGESGIKAYLKTMFVTIEEDELERKYAQDPDSQVPGRGEGFE